MKKFAGISFLCFLLLSCVGCVRKLYDGEYIVVTGSKSGQDGFSIHTEYKPDALAASENGDALCRMIEKNATVRGGSITLSDGSKISLNITVQTPSGENGRTEMYGISAPSIEVLEDKLGVQLLKPEGLQEEATGRNYAVTAEPDFREISIQSVPVPWGDETVVTEAVIFPRQAGTKVADDTVKADVKALRMNSEGGIKADVLIQDSSRSHIILHSDGVLYEYTLSSGEKEMIQKFLDSLS
jgi:hypothetical protein